LFHSIPTLFVFIGTCISFHFTWYISFPLFWPLPTTDSTCSHSTLTDYAFYHMILLFPVLLRLGHWVCNHQTSTAFSIRFPYRPDSFYYLLCDCYFIHHCSDAISDTVTLFYRSTDAYAGDSTVLPPIHFIVVRFYHSTTFCIWLLLMRLLFYWYGISWERHGVYLTWFRLPCHCSPFTSATTTYIDTDHHTIDLQHSTFLTIHSLRFYCCYIRLYYLFDYTCLHSILPLHYYRWEFDCYHCSGSFVTFCSGYLPVRPLFVTIPFHLFYSFTRASTVHLPEFSFHCLLRFRCLLHLTCFHSLPSLHCLNHFHLPTFVSFVWFKFGTFEYHTFRFTTFPHRPPSAIHHHLPVATYILGSRKKISTVSLEFSLFRSVIHSIPSHFYHSTIVLPLPTVRPTPFLLFVLFIHFYTLFIFLLLYEYIPTTIPVRSVRGSYERDGPTVIRHVLITSVPLGATFDYILIPHSICSYAIFSVPLLPSWEAIHAFYIPSTVGCPDHFLLRFRGIVLFWSTFSTCSFISFVPTTEIPSVHCSPIPLTDHFRPTIRCSTSDFDTTSPMIPTYGDSTATYHTSVYHKVFLFITFRYITTTPPWVVSTVRCRSHSAIYLEFYRWSILPRLISTPTISGITISRYVTVTTTVTTDVHRLVSTIVHCSLTGACHSVHHSAIHFHLTTELTATTCLHTYCSFLPVLPSYHTAITFTDARCVVLPLCSIHHSFVAVPAPWMLPRSLRLPPTVTHYYILRWPSPFYTGTYTDYSSTTPHSLHYHFYLRCVPTHLYHHRLDLPFLPLFVHFFRSLFHFAYLFYFVVVLRTCSFTDTFLHLPCYVLFLWYISISTTELLFSCSMRCIPLTGTGTPRSATTVMLDDTIHTEFHHFAWSWPPPIDGYQAFLQEHSRALPLLFTYRLHLQSLHSTWWALTTFAFHSSATDSFLESFWAVRYPLHFLFLYSTRIPLFRYILPHGCLQISTIPIRLPLPPHHPTVTFPDVTDFTCVCITVDSYSPPVCSTRHRWYRSAVLHGYTAATDFLFYHHFPGILHSGSDLPFWWFSTDLPPRHLPLLPYRPTRLPPFSLTIRWMWFSFTAIRISTWYLELQRFSTVITVLRYWLQFILFWIHRAPHFPTTWYRISDFSSTGYIPAPFCAPCTVHSAFRFTHFVSLPMRLHFTVTDTCSIPYVTILVPLHFVPILPLDYHYRYRHSVTTTLAFHSSGRVHLFPVLFAIRFYVYHFTDTTQNSTYHRYGKNVHFTYTVMGRWNLPILHSGLLPLHIRGLLPYLPVVLRFPFTTTDLPLRWHCCSTILGGTMGGTNAACIHHLHHPPHSPFPLFRSVDHYGDIRKYHFTVVDSPTFYLRLPFTTFVRRLAWPIYHSVDCSSTDTVFYLRYFCSIVLDSVSFCCSVSSTTQYILLLESFYLPVHPHRGILFILPFTFSGPRSVDRLPVCCSLPIVHSRWSFLQFTFHCYFLIHSDFHSYHLPYIMTSTICSISIPSGTIPTFPLIDILFWYSWNFVDTPTAYHSDSGMILDTVFDSSSIHYLLPFYTFLVDYFRFTFVALQNTYRLLFLPTVLLPPPTFYTTLFYSDHFYRLHHRYYSHIPYHFILHTTVLPICSFWFLHIITDTGLGCYSCILTISDHLPVYFLFTIRFAPVDLPFWHLFHWNHHSTILRSCSPFYLKISFTVYNLPTTLPFRFILTSLPVWYIISDTTIRHFITIRFHYTYTILPYVTISHLPPHISTLTDYIPFPHSSDRYRSVRDWEVVHYPFTVGPGVYVVFVTMHYHYFDRCWCLHIFDFDWHFCSTTLMPYLPWHHTTTDTDSISYRSLHTIPSVRYGGLYDDTTDSRYLPLICSFVVRLHFEFIPPRIPISIPFRYLPDDTCVVHLFLPFPSRPYLLTTTTFPVRHSVVVLPVVVCSYYHSTTGRLPPIRSTDTPTHLFISPPVR